MTSGWSWSVFRSSRAATPAPVRRVEAAVRIPRSPTTAPHGRTQDRDRRSDPAVPEHVLSHSASPGPHAARTRWLRVRLKRCNRGSDRCVRASTLHPPTTPQHPRTTRCTRTARGVRGRHRCAHRRDRSPHRGTRSLVAYGSHPYSFAPFASYLRGFAVAFPPRTHPGGSSLASICGAAASSARFRSGTLCPRGMAITPVRASSTTP